MNPDNDYPQNMIPSVFVEATQTPAPPARDAAAGGRRGAVGLAVIASLATLAAAIAAHLVLQNNDQVEWSNARQKLELQRANAVERATRLEESNARLASDLEAARTKIEKYSVIEYQLALVREKSRQIEDLRKAKPDYPHASYMNLAAVPEWSAPGEKLLKDFVLKLDAERLRLIAFQPHGAPLPVSPQLTPSSSGQ